MLTFQLLNQILCERIWYVLWEISGMGEGIDFELIECVKWIRKAVKTGQVSY